MVDTFNYPPPPTFADITVYNEVTGQQQFSQAWLDWFLQMVGYMQSPASGIQGTPGEKGDTGATGSPGTGGSGTVTHTAGALDADELVIGNGAADLKTLGSLGIATEILTSQGPGLPPIWAENEGLTIKQSLTFANPLPWDEALGDMAAVTLTGNTVLQMPTDGGGAADPETLILIVTQDGVGGRLMTYAAGYKFPGGVPFVLSTGANKIDILTFVHDGTFMFGVGQKAFA